MHSLLHTASDIATLPLHPAFPAAHSQTHTHPHRAPKALPCCCLQLKASQLRLEIISGGGDHEVFVLSLQLFPSHLASHPWHLRTQFSAQSPSGVPEPTCTRAPPGQLSPAGSTSPRGFFTRPGRAATGAPSPAAEGGTVGQWDSGPS